MPRLAQTPLLRPTGLAVLSAGALAALLGTVGADFRWAAALGRIIVARSAIPDGVPFATAPSESWRNVPVAAEVVAAWMTDAFGERGMYLLQLAAVVIAFAALAWTMRRLGSPEGASALVLLLVAFGSIGALAVARLQLFSLALFGVLLAILYSSSGPRSARKLWALPPLFALWANLHGAVLVGVGVAGVFLAFERLRGRPVQTVAIGAASLAALLATPVLLETPDYFLGVVQSEAARQGAGLWAPLSASPLDIATVVAGLTLAFLARRGGMRPWEIAAALVLAGLTIHTARSGIWFLLLVAVPASRGASTRGRIRPVTSSALATALLALIVVGIVRGPLSAGAGASLVRTTVAQAGSGPILAQDVLGEQVVLRRGTIVVGNPLDAFSRRDQRLFLAWSRGDPSGDALLRRTRVVLVHADSAAARRMASLRRFRVAARDNNAILYVAG